MKKVLLTLFIAGLAIVTAAQVANSDKDVAGNTRESHNWVCMDNNVFSQVPADYNVGVYCDARYPITKVAEDYTATGAFNSMRFWGVYDVKPTETFLIEFYNGKPGQVGTSVIYAFNVTTSPIPTPNLRNGQVIHEINAEFGTQVNLLNGWVSVSRTTLPFITQFAWIGDGQYYPARNSISYDSGSDVWIDSTRAQFFCLGTSGVIPVSNWALFIGLGLIVAFTIIRFRKA